MLHVLNERDIRTLEKVTVVAVSLSAVKGVPKTPVESIRISSAGIEGDAHAGTPGRNVSLLDYEVVKRFISETGIENIGHGAFGENLTVKINGAHRLSAGDEIKIGDVRLIVTRIGKECHGKSCSIFRRTGQCVMPADGVFCSVVSCGELSAGMTGTIRAVKSHRR